MSFNQSVSYVDVCFFFRIVGLACEQISLFIFFYCWCHSDDRLFYVLTSTTNIIYLVVIVMQHWFNNRIKIISFTEWNMVECCRLLNSQPVFDFQSVSMFHRNRKQRLKLDNSLFYFYSFLRHSIYCLLNAIVWMPFFFVSFFFFSFRYLFTVDFNLLRYNFFSRVHCIMIYGVNIFKRFQI